MAEMPYIARSACKHGITYVDVYLLLRDPMLVESMVEIVELAAKAGKKLDEPDRPNVDVFVGHDSFGHPLVVFVERFRNMAFHSEPGWRRFGWLFR